MALDRARFRRPPLLIRDGFEQTDRAPLWLLGGLGDICGSEADSSRDFERLCGNEVIMIYSPGTALTLSTAPARILGPPQKNLKVVMIYSPGTALTLSMAPARIPGAPAKTPKGRHDLFSGHRTNPKYGARAHPWPPRKKP